MRWVCWRRSELQILVLIFSGGKWFINGSISHSALNNQFLLIVYYWSIGVFAGVYTCQLFERGRKCHSVLYLSVLLHVFFSRKWAAVESKASAAAVEIDIFRLWGQIFPSNMSHLCTLCNQELSLHHLFRGMLKQTPLNTFKRPKKNPQGREFLSSISSRCCIIWGFAAT